MPTTVLLADDHQMVTAGFAALLENEPDLEVVGGVSDGLSAVEQCAALKPDVVAMDLTMPGMNGLEATRRITENPEIPTRVLIVSMHSDPEFVAEALRNGATGYVLKHAAGQELVKAMKAIGSGGTYLSPAVAGTVVEKYIRGGEGGSPPRYALLSPRERQTLQMLAEGMSVKEIAYQLELSDKTVHAFRARMMEKLEIQSIAELTKYAVRHGLTSLN